MTGLVWPFRAGKTKPDAFEPSDEQLGATPPPDPFDSPSYNKLTAVTNQGAFDAMAARMFPSTKGTTK